MEFLAFSELHADKNHNKSSVTIGGLTTWMENTSDTLSQIFAYGLNNNVFNIFHGGDLFEKKNYLPQDLYNFIWEEFEYAKGLGFNINLNTGNHDFHSKISSSLKPFSTITNVIVEPTDLIMDDELIRIIPYGMVDKNLKIPEGEYKRKILFIHEDIAGLKYGSNDYISGSKYKRQIFSDWDFVFNGHIHKAQRLGNIINMGSVMRHDFGETDKKYFYHYKDGEIKEIEIKCPEFIVVSGFSEKIRAVAEKNNYDFFRIDITPEELTDPIFKKYNVFPNIVKMKEKKKRLTVDMTEDEEILKYMEIMESDLDKDKVLKMVKEL